MAQSVEMSNSSDCSNLIPLGTPTKLITVWHNNAVRKPPHGVVHCVEVKDIDPFKLKIKQLPVDYSIGVKPLNMVTGTVTIDDDLVTWTLPPNDKTTDRWMVEVVDVSGPNPVVKHALEMKLENP